MVETRRLLTRFGYVAPVLSVGFVFLSTLVDPEFSWQSRSLSSIGEATGTSVFALGSLDQLAWTLFNSGLFLAGFLGFPFLVVLWMEAEQRIDRIGIVTMALTLVGSMGVGVSYLDGPYAFIHFPMAALFFFGLTFTLWIYSTGLVKRTGADTGLGGIWLANAHATIWVLWMVLEALVFTGDGDTWTWFAVPEFVGAVIFGSWVVLQARRLDAEFV
jgi:hypothetical membrane protein